MAARYVWTWLRVLHDHCRIALRLQRLESFSDGTPSVNEVAAPFVCTEPARSPACGLIGEFDR